MEKLRKEFVNEVLLGEKSKSQICREYGIGRVTGDKWLKRAGEGNEYEDRSRAPFRTPNKSTAETEAKIIAVRESHPAWGARKIKRYLENHGTCGLPAISTICAILKRNGMVSQEASIAATPYKRFEREAPNQLWQTDFKGHFAMLNGARCHPLTVIDDHSRFAISVDAKENEQFEGVHQSFIAIFRKYGLPDSLLCDNGNPWGTSQTTGFTRFEVFLMDLGILPIHGRIWHPQTQGKDERFNRTLKDEVLKTTTITDFLDAQAKFDAFRYCYNHERPHAALDFNVPASRYAHSARAFPEKIATWEYSNGAILKQVRLKGYLKFNGQGFFLSEALAGLTVQLLESQIDGCFNIRYRNFCIGSINQHERCLSSRKIRLIDGD